MPSRSASTRLGCATKASLTIFLQFVFLTFRSCIPLGFCDSPRMGQQHISPGQSTAPPWVRCPPTRDCPEGAKLVGIGCMCRNCLFGPFRAMGVARGCVPRAALRFALGCHCVSPLGYQVLARFARNARSQHSSQFNLLISQNALSSTRNLPSSTRPTLTLGGLDFLESWAS